MWIWLSLGLDISHIVVGVLTSPDSADESLEEPSCRSNGDHNLLSDPLSEDWTVDASPTAGRHWTEHWILSMLSHSYSISSRGKRTMISYRCLKFSNLAITQQNSRRSYPSFRLLEIKVPMKVLTARSQTQIEAQAAASNVIVLLRCHSRNTARHSTWRKGRINISLPINMRLPRRGLDVISEWVSEIGANRWRKGVDSRGNFVRSHCLL